MMISFLRTALLYIVIIIAVRLMGKRQISELQTSELVVTLLISDIAAIPMQDSGQPLVSGLLPIGILIVCEILASIWMLKNTKIRRAICGRPIVVINNGKIEQQEMRRLRMSTEDLSAQLRQKNIFTLEDVAYAIMETNGKMSVIKKADKDSPTAEMLGIVPPDTGIETVVVNDGVISDFSLMLIHKDKLWLEGILQKETIPLSEIFIMTANVKGDFQIIKKESTKTT